MSNIKRKIICEQCGMVLELPSLSGRLVGICPRCGKVLYKFHAHWVPNSFCYALVAVIFGLLADVLPFISIKSAEISNSMEMLDYTTILVQQNYSVISFVIFLVMQLLPFLVLATILLSDLGCMLGVHWRLPGFLLKFYRFALEWSMLEVFMASILVSLVKLVSLVEVSYGNGFWCFFGYPIFYLLAINRFNWRKAWNYYVPIVEPSRPLKCGVSAEPQNFESCERCGGIVDLKMEEHCPRCGGHVRKIDPYSVQRCFALCMAALVLYIVSNMYPMMITSYLGVDEPSTIIEGVILLWDLGSYFVAGVIFVASIFIPLLKIGLLLYLCFSVNRFQRTRNKHRLSVVFRLVEFIGKWSMIDVFVVAIMASVVRMGNLMVIYPGNAVLVFAGVVVITILAAKSFDCRLFWARVIPSKE